LRSNCWQFAIRNISFCYLDQQFPSYMKTSVFEPLSRRKFVQTSITGLSAAAAAINGVTAQPRPSQLTISQAIDIIRQSISLDTSKGTVDTIKSGDPDQPLRGIVSTMFANVDVIRGAADLGANLIIAHEPTFYNHLDEKEWLKDHQVFKMKQALLNKHNIVVWRFHDYWHANRPDGVLMGVLAQLGWQEYYNENNPAIVTIPGSTLSAIIKLTKKNLGIEKIRYIGDPDAVCKTIAVLPGAWGGRRQIQALHESAPDLLICGELQEWETSEYVRDARSLNLNRALIVLGHAVSEEPGMKWLVDWLKPKIPGVNITHIPSGNPFKFM
jgi:putative NIF3 family GTP cyclohydrolase 1 type 2